LLVQETFGPWVWERARPFEPKDRADVVALVERAPCLAASARRISRRSETPARREDRGAVRAYGFELAATRAQHMELFGAAVQAQDFELDSAAGRDPAARARCGRQSSSE